MCELAYAEGIWTQTCFHAQQTVEIALKAQLAARERRIPRTHTVEDLLDLMDQATKEALADQEGGMHNLDRYYVPTRYPDAMPGALPEGPPDKPEATDALAVATAVMAILDR